MKRAAAMVFFQPFLAVLVILQESFKLLAKNRKLIALTFVPSLLLSSLIFIVFNISSKSMADNMYTISKSFISMSSTGEFTPEFASALSRFKEDTGLLFLIYLAFIFASSIISILSTTAYILLSAVSKTERTLSFKDFALLVVKKCIRPVITAFYTYLLGLGYFFFVLAISAPIFMFSEFGLWRVPLSIILFGICAYVLYMYYSMTWILSLVVSVVEENCYGIEALGKAAELIKGKRLQGFILNAIFAAFSLVVYQGMRIFARHGWLIENYTVLMLFVLSLSALVKLFLFVTYTVLYFHCKKHHGEEFELQGGSAEMYQKISNAPLVGDDMA